MAKKPASQRRVRRAAPAAPKQNYATIWPGKDHPLHPQIVASVKKIEQALGMPVVLLIQDGRSEFGDMDHELHGAFVFLASQLPLGKPIALLLQSPGGYAESAFRIARLLRNRCGGFTVLVPGMAKSAATLLALGADRIIMGAQAEFGPLDAQIDDTEREQSISALEVVQSVERLNSEAMQAVDAIMRQWIRSSGKRTDILLPIATQFVAEMLRPLFDKIDTIKYTQMARVLKIGQDYAERLLERHYGQPLFTDGITLAGIIAATLTKSYSDHGFVISADELRDLGLKIDEPPPDIADILTPLGLPIPGSTMVGLVKEVP